MNLRYHLWKTLRTEKLFKEDFKTKKLFVEDFKDWDTIEGTFKGLRYY